MGREEEAELISSTPKLPLLSHQLPPIDSPERSGMLTPPLHASASVPFRWEEEPGKPRPITSLILSSGPTTTTGPKHNNKSLELPPRLQLTSTTDSKMTKRPSPTTVLEGPDMPLFQSSSFRFMRQEGFFWSSCGSPPDGGQFGNSVVLESKGGIDGKERGGLFGSWRRQPRIKSRSVGGGSFVFSYSMDLVDFGGDESGGTGKVKQKKKMMGGRVGRNGSFSSLSQVRPHVWATIYRGFKQVLLWKSTKSKKDGLII